MKEIAKVFLVASLALLVGLFIGQQESLTCVPVTNVTYANGTTMLQGAGNFTHAFGTVASTTTWCVAVSSEGAK